MTENERHNLLTEARQYQIAAPILLPILEKRKHIAMTKLMQKYREGATDYLTLVAELSVLTDLARELTSKESTFQLLEEPHGKATERK